MDTNNKKLYKQFNKHLKKVLKLLKKLFPNMIEFRIIYVFFKMLKTINPGKPQRIFHKNLGIYREYIENEDEDFFLNKFLYKDYSGKKLNLTKFFESLKTSWSYIDKTHKSIIWKETKHMLKIDDEIKTKNIVNEQHIASKMEST